MPKLYSPWRSELGKKKTSSRQFHWTRDADGPATAGSVYVVVLEECGQYCTVKVSLSRRGLLFLFPLVVCYSVRRPLT